MGHEVFHHELDMEEFWNFGFAEMGTKDLPAMIKTMKYYIDQDVEDPHILHTDKILYIGYDIGATQLLYGLAHMEDSFFSQYVRGAIMLAPCTQINTVKGQHGFQYYNELIQEIDIMGLYGLYGLNWHELRPSFCAHLGHHWCERDINWEEEPISAKTFAHIF